MRFSSILGLVSLFPLVTVPAFADGIGLIEDGIPTANTATGSPPTRIDFHFRTRLIATGSERLENPNGVITNFGMLSNLTRTEPDQNTYLVLDHNPGGPTAGFNYGKHF